MAARVIHYGWDDCYRVQVLRSAGFEVWEAPSLSTLDLDLQRDEPVDAVIVSEESRQSTEQALEMVRRRSLAPVILFRRAEPDVDHEAFDRVYSWCVPPAQWLSQTAELIARGRELQKESARLVREARAVREEIRRQCARSKHERTRIVLQKQPSDLDDSKH